jgi:hypothetical protein
MSEVEKIAAGLEPCPFPHDVQRGPFIERDTEDFFFVRVSCGDCGCAGPYIPLDREDGKSEEAQAIAAWNVRRHLQEQANVR